MTTKMCTGCDYTLPVEDFWKGCSKCKACLKTERKAKYDPEYHRQYRLDRIEEKRAYDRARSGDPDRVERIRAWTEENREFVREQNRKRYAANPTPYREYNRNRKARLKDAEGTHTRDEVLCMLVDQDGKCAYCEKPLGDDYHVDHMVPLSRGGRNDWENLAVTCPTCNLEKGPKTVEEYINHRGAVLVA